MNKTNSDLVWDNKLKRGFLDFRALLSLCIMIFSPPLVFLFNYVLVVHEGSFASFLTQGLDIDTIVHLYSLSADNYIAVKLYVFWIVFTLALAKFFPGKKYLGSITQGGNQLEYLCNGFQVFLFTSALYIGGSFFGFFNGSIIAKYFSPYLVLSCSFGIFVTIFSYVKGRFFPTHKNDVRISGNFFHDLFSGIELNPRTWGIDYKLYFNGRPGIGLWSLINISFAIMQYEKFGVVTNGMIVCNYLQFLYVIDYFYNEAWYLKTIDIQTDSFGFYLAWGDLSWLPFMYTLQCQYLSFHPTQIPIQLAVCLAIVGTLGFIGFRVANHQKKIFKDSKGDCIIWGKQADFIETTFHTADGRTHEGKLLTSGFWGICRRINYTFDLIGCLCYCMCCGFDNLIIPYFYFYYMIILLSHRLLRDNNRLTAKYGKHWGEYKKKVKYWLIPGVF